MMNSVTLLSLSYRSSLVLCTFISLAHSRRAALSFAISIQKFIPIAKKKERRGAILSTYGVGAERRPVRKVRNRTERRSVRKVRNRTEDWQEDRRKDRQDHKEDREKESKEEGKNKNLWKKKNVKLDVERRKREDK